MYAAVYFKPRLIALQKVKDPEIDPNEVLVRVGSCAICGFDISVYKRGSPKIRAPVILGHEIAGEIAHSRSPRFREGMRVAVYPVIPCGKCVHCIKTRYNLCDHRQELGSTRDGGFAEYLLVPSVIIELGGLIEIPNYMPYEEAALIEPLACCVNGINKMHINNGDSVAIIGDGTIGLLHLQLARALGAQTIVIGRIEDRLAVAKVLGADLIVNSSSIDPVTAVREFTQGKGADVVIVAVGELQAIYKAIQIAAKNGRINIFAGVSSNAKMELDPNILHYSEIMLTGSFSSTPQLMEEALCMIKARKVNLKPLITHRFALSEILTGLEMAGNYKGLRTVINP